MQQEKVTLNTCPMYQHCDTQTQVYIITGPKGSKIADRLKTVRWGVPPDRAACLLLPEMEGFQLDSWPVDPKANMYEILAGIARSLKSLPDDKVLCAIVFGEHVDFFKD